MNPDHTNPADDSNAMANIQAQPFIAMESIVYALSKQPGFDSKGFVELLRQEEQRIDDKHSIVKSFLRRLIDHGESLGRD